MPAAPIPGDEEERLRTLYSYGLLDSMAEESFDEICQLAAHICDTPIALITLIDRHRQWFKSAIGLDVRETERECAFCAYAILEREVLVLEDACKDQRFCDNRLVLASPKVRFYAGEPLSGYNGMRIGTLCVIDTKPRVLTEEQKNILGTLARQVEAQLELRRLNAELARVDQARERLSQFAAHDLSTPLTAILLATRELSPHVRPEAADLLDTISAAADSIERMISDLRDISVSRAGALAPRWQPFDLAELIANVHALATPRLREAQVVLQEQLAWEPARVEADPDLLRRLIQNLVQNAIEHSPRSGTVVVLAELSAPDHYRLSVRDQGAGIPESLRGNLFDLYARGESTHHVSRGIGLAFCRAAAEAHGGTIEAHSEPGRGSVFSVRLPLRRPRVEG